MKPLQEKGAVIGDGKRVWKCTICGELFHWDKNSSWYGLEEHPDTWERDIHGVFCSKPCANKFVPSVTEIKPKRGKKGKRK